MTYHILNRSFPKKIYSINNVEELEDLAVFLGYEVDKQQRKVEFLDFFNNPKKISWDSDFFQSYYADNSDSSSIYEIFNYLVAQLQIHSHNFIFDMNQYIANLFLNYEVDSRMIYGSLHLEYKNLLSSAFRIYKNIHFYLPGLEKNSESYDHYPLYEIIKDKQYLIGIDYIIENSKV